MTLNTSTLFCKAMQELKMRSNGWDNLIPFTQATLETGNFTSKLAKDGYNYFGIKWTKNCGYPYMVVADDLPDDRFRVYSSASDCLNDYISKLKKMYTYAYEHRNDYKEFFFGLQHGNEDWMKWATSKTYIENLTKLYEKLDRPEFHLLINDYKV